MSTENNNKNLNVPNKRAQSQTCLGYAERAEQSPQGNVPNMRFPEFSGEWKKTTIGRCCGDLEYGMNAAAKIFDGVNKYIRITDIDENTSSYIQSDIVSPDAQLEEKYRVVLNDILFARTGASTGKSYLYNPEDGKLYFAGFLIRANVKENYNSRFVFLQTKTSAYKRWVTIMSARSGQPGINSQEYASYSFNAPTLTEQNKIADLFRMLDERIATQIKIIEDLKKLKSAISKILFEHCERAFNIRLLGDICKITTGKLDANAMTDDGEYPFFTCAREDYKTDTFAFDGDSLLISGNGEIGIVKRYNGKFNAYQRTYVLQNFSENIEYLMYYIEYHLPKRVLKEKNVGAMPYIVLSTLSEMPIKIPDIKEQTAICKTLNCLSELIELNSKLKSSYTSQKSCLLAQMFI